MKKKLLCVLLSLALFASLIPAGVLSLPVGATDLITSGGYTYYVSDGDDFVDVSDGEVIITSYNTGDSYGGDVTIPSTLGGYPVAAIDAYAFADCEKITAITIPEGVGSIEREAFENCTGLTSITIPSSVRFIGYRAFEWCDNLTAVHITDIAAWCSIEFIDDFSSNPLYFAQNLYLDNVLVTDLVIPDSVTSIAEYAFINCDSLTSVTIPDSVTTIGIYAFRECTNMASVAIPDSVTTIDICAFYECTELNSVIIPDSVTTIGYCAFKGCSNLTAITVDKNNSTYCSVEGVLFDKDKTTLIQFPGRKRGAYVIPNSVTTIENGAFYNCAEVTSVVIPSGVTIIDCDTFGYCTSLTSITIPDSVVGIGFEAFRDCTSLAAVTIPDSVVGIGDEAFYGCTGLATVILEGDVTDFGSSVFGGCTGLTLVRFGAGVTRISDYAFALCTSLTTVDVLGSVTDIGEGAFAYCVKLASVTIPASVTTVELGAFAFCPSLAKVLYKGTEKQAKQIVVDNYSNYNDPFLNAVWSYNYVPPCKTHTYAAATCTKAKTCKVCGVTSGKKLGHTYTNACDKSCNRCKATRTITHTYTAATCTKAKTCKVCGVTSGKALGHTYKKVVVKKATQSANGSYKNVCTKCGYTASKRVTLYKASSVKLSTGIYTYTGSVKKPTVTVKDSNGKTISSSHYTVSYASGRKNVGAYKVTVKFKNYYSGTKTLTFKINPVKTSVKSLTAGKKSLKVAITKKTAQVSGYQIQYSTSKSFKSYKTKTLSSYKKTSTTLTGLSAKKTYYVRVRTYKTVNGKKIYSGWSTIKYKKTK